MAIEAKRGCGFRQEGGLYLMGGRLAAPCCWLPHELNVCPTCGAGIKQARGWTWVTPSAIFAGQECELPAAHFSAPDPTAPDGVRLGKWTACPLTRLEGRHGLIWVGERFYPTPADFTAEGASLGVSRRINSVPKGFVLGETWVLFAHPKVIKVSDGQFDINQHYLPAIFSVFLPTSIDIIVKESELTDEKRAELEKRGLTPVAVPDDDPDHCPHKAA